MVNTEIQLQKHIVHKAAVVASSFGTTWGTAWRRIHYVPHSGSTTNASDYPRFSADSPSLSSDVCLQSPNMYNPVADSVHFIFMWANRLRYITAVPSLLME